MLGRNLGNPPRAPASCGEVEHRSRTAVRRKPVEIGAGVVRHGRYITFQMAEVAVPRDLLRKIPRLIDALEHYPTMSGVTWDGNPRRD